MDYAYIYQKLEKRFRKYQSYILKSNQSLTALMYLAYPLILLYYFFKQRGEIAKAILIPAIGFIILTEMRKVINRPRPYEKWSINPIIKKDTKGLSFPSRHVFSAMIIAITGLYISIPLGILLIIVSLLIGLLRILGGVHYPSDIAFAILQATITGLFFWIL